MTAASARQPTSHFGPVGAAESELRMFSKAKLIGGITMNLFAKRIAQTGSKTIWPATAGPRHAEPGTGLVGALDCLWQWAVPLWLPRSALLAHNCLEALLELRHQLLVRRVHLGISQRPFGVPVSKGVGHALVARRHVLAPKYVEQVH